jgi:hypothetical protein
MSIYPLARDIDVEAMAKAMTKLPCKWISLHLGAIARSPSKMSLSG